MIRVASIGYGDIAQRARFPELLKLQGRAELVAIAGRNPEGLAACARRFGIPKTYTDVDEMLAREAIDAVLILTPPASHAPLAVKCVQAGKHVLLEKPMVRSLAEARQILDAVVANPVVFFALPDVDSPAHEFVRQLLATGIVGEITSVECHKGHRGPTHADWFYKKEIAGGGVLFDLGIYALSEVALLFGPAARLSALCATRFPERRMDDGHIVRPDVEDIALVNLWLENGIAVTVNANFNGYLSHHHTRSRLLVIGREGMLHFGVPDGYIYVHRLDERYDAFMPGGEPAEFDGYRAWRYAPRAQAGRAHGMMERFLDRIERRDTDTTPLQRQIHVMEQMLVAYECGGLSDLRPLQTRF